MATVTKKPNIVFVLCDNIGWGDFGVYGGGTPTPRIDKLASEGHPFQQLHRRGAVHTHQVSHHDGSPVGAFGHVQGAAPV
jgi:hypothetical protein